MLVQSAVSSAGCGIGVVIATSGLIHYGCLPWGGTLSDGASHPPLLITPRNKWQPYAELDTHEKRHCAGKKGGEHGVWLRMEEGLASPHTPREVDPELETIARVSEGG